MSVFVIGIAGGSASGKTTVTKQLEKRFAGDIAVIYQDSYYKKNDHLTAEERKSINYDSPEAFDNELLISDIKKLKDGQSIESPIYDYAVHNRSDKTQTVRPERIIITEGILVLQDEKLRDCFDLKVFVEADADIRLIRRIKRDVYERGRTVESVIEQYINTVRPMHEMYIEPSKKYADIIVAGVDDSAAQIVGERIEAVLSSQLK